MQIYQDFWGKVMLFQNERFNVKQIDFVTNYSPEIKKIHKFPGKLPTYELMYFYKGEVRLEFDNKSFFVKTGDVVYLPKKIENNRYHIIADHRFGLYNIYFDTYDSLPKQAVHIPLQNRNLKSLYEAIHRVWMGKKQGYYFKSMQLFYEILQFVIKLQGNYTKRMDSGFYASLEEYISKHFCDRNFNYEELAEISGFSYSYFKKLFISIYGVSPIKYITELRMNYACELLSSGKYKVSDVAQLCGYENVYYFSTVFKKYKGTSPKNHIAAIKENTEANDSM